MGGYKYDNPNFLIIRDHHIHGSTISAPSLGDEYIGSTLKVYNKSVVLGVTFQFQSAGSAAATQSIAITRCGTGGTNSDWQVLVTSSSAGLVVDISLASALTIHSLGEGAALRPSAASLDKIGTIKNIVWRYRMLPQEIPDANIG